jgi:hypothetical protein
VREMVSSQSHENAGVILPVWAVAESSETRLNPHAVGTGYLQYA